MPSPSATSHVETAVPEVVTEMSQTIDKTPDLQVVSHSMQVSDTVFGGVA